jgi:formylmethanofuran dehydrogenase subunit E
MAVWSMGRLDIFSEGERAPEAPKPTGVEVYATVQCQTCGEEVDEQLYFASEKVLVWRCSQRHKSAIEGFSLG